MFTIYFPTPDIRSTKVGFVSVLFLDLLPFPERCLAQSLCSLNVCWVNEEAQSGPLRNSSRWPCRQNKPTKSSTRVLSTDCERYCSEFHGHCPHQSWEAAGSPHVVDKDSCPQPAALAPCDLQQVTDSWPLFSHVSQCILKRLSLSLCHRDHTPS